MRDENRLVTIFAILFFLFISFLIVLHISREKDIETIELRERILVNAYENNQIDSRQLNYLLEMNEDGDFESREDFTLKLNKAKRLYKYGE